MLQVLAILFAVLVSAAFCYLWEVFRCTDLTGTHALDHLHWGLLFLGFSVFPLIHQNYTLFSIALGLAIPPILLETDWEVLKNLKKVDLIYPLAGLALGFSVSTMVKMCAISDETLLALFVFTAVSLGAPYLVVIDRAAPALAVAATPMRTALLNRYFWIIYIMSALYFFYYSIFYIFDPKFHIGAFYGITGILCVFFIYALQRRESEEELRRLLKILKPTEENVRMLASISIMTFITFIIWIAIMVPTGAIMQASTVTIASMRGMVIELSPEVKIILEYWFFEILSNLFLVAFGEEVLCALFVAIGYRMRQPRGMLAATLLTQAWVIAHVIWKPYIPYLIALSIIRTAVTILYFIPLEIWGMRFRENLVSAILAHGLNNMLSILASRGIVPL